MIFVWTKEILTIKKGQRYYSSIETTFHSPQKYTKLLKSRGWNVRSYIYFVTLQPWWNRNNVFVNVLWLLWKNLKKACFVPIAIWLVHFLLVSLLVHFPEMTWHTIRNLKLEGGKFRIIYRVENCLQTLITNVHGLNPPARDYI